MCVRMRRSLYHAGCALNLIQPNVRRTDNRQNNAVRTVDGGLQQRRLNCLLRRFLCLVLSDSSANAHVRISGALHHRGNISKVQVNQTRYCNQLRNRGNCLTQYIISNFKCISKGNFLFGHILQTFIRDDNQGIHVLLQRFDTGVCLLHTLLALKRERTGDNAYRQNAHLAGNLCNDRRTASAGAAAHTGCDEYHMCAFQSGRNLLAALLRCLTTDLRLGTCALSLRQLCADLNFNRRFRAVQCLFIRIDCNKF